MYRANVHTTACRCIFICLSISSFIYLSIGIQIAQEEAQERGIEREREREREREVGFGFRYLVSRRSELPCKHAYVCMLAACVYGCMYECTYGISKPSILGQRNTQSKGQQRLRRTCTTTYQRALPKPVPKIQNPEP